MRFQDRCEKRLTSNPLTTVTVDRISVTKESKVPTIYMKPEESVYL